MILSFCHMPHVTPKYQLINVQHQQQLTLNYWKIISFVYAWRHHKCMWVCLCILLTHYCLTLYTPTCSAETRVINNEVCCPDIYIPDTYIQPKGLKVACAFKCMMPETWDCLFTVVKTVANSQRNSIIQSLETKDGIRKQQYMYYEKVCVTS